MDPSRYFVALHSYFSLVRPEMESDIMQSQLECERNGDHNIIIVMWSDNRLPGRRDFQPFRLLFVLTSHLQGVFFLCSSQCLLTVYVFPLHSFALYLSLFRSRSLIVPARRAIKNSKFYACQKSRNNKANRMKTIRNEWKKRNKEQKTIHLWNSSTHVFNNFLRLVVPFLFKWLRRSVVAVKHSKTKQKNSSERKTANNKFIAFDRCLVPLYMTESKKKSRREQAPFVTFVMWLRTQILEMRKWVLKINDSTGNIDVTRWLLRVF